MMSDLKLYELMLLFTPEMAETAVLKEISLIKDRISKTGKVTIEDFWGKRPLAYPIKKMESGYYQVFRFSFSPEEVKELDQELRLTPSVLRFLITIPPKGMELVLHDAIYSSESAFSSEKKANKRKVRNTSKRVESLPNSMPFKKHSSHVRENENSSEKDS
jgi:small subunit ribosomal protein S6